MNIITDAEQLQEELRCLRILADDFMDLMRDNPEVSLVCFAR